MSDVILVIDRETALTDEVAQALDGSDVRVLRAGSAEEAFEHLEWGWVDVVICTPEMPGADGFDLVPQLRRRHPRLAIAFASDAEPGRVAAEALERGVSETLPRPIQRSARVCKSISAFDEPTACCVGSCGVPSESSPWWRPPAR